MSGRDRNRACWCGSGRKYKHCHLDRETQQSPSIWDARKEFNNALKPTACLHPLAGSGTCSGPSVRAHTVRRAADLGVIARRGHVYQVSADLADLYKHNGKPLPKLIGINNASTFLGFCSHHDAETFAPLELRALLPTDEQAFLLAYRPLCKELYLKERQLESLEIIRAVDKGRPMPDQLRIQEDVFLMRVGVEAAIGDLRLHKAKYDQDLLTSDFSQTRFVAVHLDRVPDLMCSGSVQPHYTFDGQPIQDLGDLRKKLEVMSFSLAATATGGVAVFAWRADSDPSGSRLVDSLLALPATDIPHALVRYATSQFENTYLRPEWWEALPKAASASLIDRLAHNADTESPVNPKNLMDDGYRTVDWAVTQIVQKRI